MDYRQIIAPRTRKVTLLEARYTVSHDLTLTSDGNFCSPFSDRFSLKIAFSPVLPLDYDGAVMWPQATVDTSDLRLVTALDVFPCEQVSAFACRYDKKTERVTLTTPAEATDVLLHFIVAGDHGCLRSTDYAMAHNFKWHGVCNTTFIEGCEPQHLSLIVMPLNPALRKLFDQLQEEYELAQTLNALSLADAEEYGEQYRHELMTLALYARDQLGWTAYMQDDALMLYYPSGDGTRVIQEWFGFNAHDVNCVEDLIRIAEEAVCGGAVL